MTNFPSNHHFMIIRRKVIIFAGKRPKKMNNPFVTNGSKFLRKYHLPSASSVASAAKGLLEKDFITNDKGTYQVYDIFFKLWLQKNKL